MGGSPGIVFMERDSCSKGREFEFRLRILDGHLFKFICYKNCMRVCKDKINAKEAGFGPFFKISFNLLLSLLLHSRVKKPMSVCLINDDVIEK